MHKLFKILVLGGAVTAGCASSQPQAATTSTTPSEKPAEAGDQNPAAAAPAQAEQPRSERQPAAGGGVMGW